MSHFINRKWRFNMTVQNKATSCIYRQADTGTSKSLPGKFSIAITYMHASFTTMSIRTTCARQILVNK